MSVIADTLPPRHPRPGPAEPRPYHFPRFERRALRNGMQLLVAHVPKLPIATMLLIAEAGALADPAGEEGVAQLTANLLLEGTDTLDGAALTERLERLGATAAASADWDIALVRCTALVEHLPHAVDLLGEVLQRPAFPAREVERLKAERIADLLQMRADPGALADETFTHVLYAEGSRYRLPAGGDEKSVPGITREQVRDFYRARYRPGAMTLIIAGALTPDEGERIADRALGGWHGQAPAAVTVHDHPAARERRVHLAAKADAPQSELRIGHVGVPRATPDYFPIVVMNAILGGLFSSRVNLNLRERHGYTYGAHTGFDWRRHAGPFVADTAVKREVTAAAIREVVMEIDRMRDEPVSEDELSLATSYLAGVFPIRYETTDAIASAIANLVVYDLGDDWLDRYRERVRNVTAADVRRAAQAHLKPQELQVVVVGDPAVVRAPLEELSVGAVHLLDSQASSATP